MSGSDLRNLLSPPPGIVANKVVEKALARSYPEVRMVWDGGVKRWRLIEKLRDGTYDSIALVTGPSGEFVQPTIANTVGFLATVDSARILQSEYAKRAFLDRLDGTFNTDGGESEWRAHDRIEEGSRRLERELGSKIMVVPWQSAPTSRRRSRRSD